MSQTMIVPRTVVSSAALAAASMGVLLAGVAVSAALSGVPWWESHLSVLGTLRGPVGVVYGLTVVWAGLLYAGWAVRSHTVHGQIPVTAAAVLLGLSLTLTGIVPVDVAPVWHDAAARGVIVGFAGMLAASAAAWPDLRQVAAVATVGLISAVTMLTLELMSLAVFEVAGFLLVGAWTVVVTARHAREVT